MNMTRDKHGCGVHAEYHRKLEAERDAFRSALERINLRFYNFDNQHPSLATNEAARQLLADIEADISGALAQGRQMTTATPKPRAGEHDETRAEQETRLNAKLVDAMGYPAYAASWESIARSACAERDLLRERERELVEALQAARAAIKTMKLGLDDSCLKLLPGLPAIEEKINSALNGSKHAM